MDDCARLTGYQTEVPRAALRVPMALQYELNLNATVSAREAGPEMRTLRNVPALIPLEPDVAQTGMRSRAQKAQRSLLPPQAIAFDAFRLTLVQCRWHIAANMAATVESQDSEGLHQLRVALRRLRVALSSFGGE